MSVNEVDTVSLVSSKGLITFKPIVKPSQAHFVYIGLQTDLIQLGLFLLFLGLKFTSTHTRPQTNYIYEYPFPSYIHYCRMASGFSVHMRFLELSYF